MNNLVKIKEQMAIKPSITEREKIVIVIQDKDKDKDKSKPIIQDTMTTIKELIPVTFKSDDNTIDIDKPVIETDKPPIVEDENIIVPPKYKTPLIIDDTNQYFDRAKLIEKLKKNKVIKISSTKYVDESLKPTPNIEIVDIPIEKVTEKVQKR